MTHFSAVRAILAGGLIVALLDGLYPVILYGLRGVPPGRVFQGIAAGLLGREAFRGGMATAALGLGLHVFIALVVVATYFAMSVRLRALRTRPLLLGPVYGVADGAGRSRDPYGRRGPSRGLGCRRVPSMAAASCSIPSASACGR